MIGIFDSGSGGLSVASVLRERAPNADLLYFGDIANAPYGEKNLDTLSALTERGVELLASRGAIELLSACNSVSSAVLRGASRGMPFIEMSLPTASLLQKFKGQRFLLIATPATVESGLYTKAVHDDVELDSLAIPGLAGAIEFGAPIAEIEDIIRSAFSERRGERYDGLILGCTHYPLIRKSIEAAARAYFGDIHIIDPAFPVVENVLENFAIEGKGTTRFLISKESAPFRARVKELFGESGVTIELVRPEAGSMLGSK